MSSPLKKQKLTIDLTSEEYQKLLAYAQTKGKSLKDIVIESIANQIALDKEQQDLSKLTNQIPLFVQEIWDNDKDSEYDKI
jgi:macrodomain Ter protein organizer (MatP/YcbG family)